MTSQTFALQPFSRPNPPRPCAIAGAITRQGRQFAIRYTLSGRLSELVIPAPAAGAARKHDLWQGTCFEFFLAARQAEGYWEFNLSPAGHWNAYRFTGYRQGMAEELAVTALPLVVQRAPDVLRMTLEFEVDRLVRADQPMSVAVAAVLKHQDGRLSYWALAHPGPQADFHRRDSFLVEL
jgi:hypothetical protein